MVPPLIVRTPEAMKGADETIEPEPLFVKPAPLLRVLPARLIDALPNTWTVPMIGGVNIFAPLAAGIGIGPVTSRLFGPNKFSVLLTRVTRFVICALPAVITDGGICAFWITPAEPRGLLLRMRLLPITVESPEPRVGIEIRDDLMMLPAHENGGF